MKLVSVNTGIPQEVKWPGRMDEANQRLEGRKQKAGRESRNRQPQTYLSVPCYARRHYECKSHYADIERIGHFCKLRMV